MCLGWPAILKSMSSLTHRKNTIQNFSHFKSNISFSYCTQNWATMCPATLKSMSSLTHRKNTIQNFSHFKSNISFSYYTQNWATMCPATLKSVINIIIWAATRQNRHQRTSGPVNTHLTPGPGRYFNAFVHVYSPRQGQTTPWGQCWCQQKALITLPICCKF